ncbi:hypothetical protein ACLOJK_016945, partial [Asimina triloba]
ISERYKYESTFNHWDRERPNIFAGDFRHARFPSHAQRSCHILACNRVRVKLDLI